MLPNRPGKTSFNRRVALILMLLLGMMLACSTSDLMGTNEDEATPTSDIEDAVQATIEALKGPTEPPPPTADLQATVNAQATMIALQNQAPPTEPPVNPAPTEPPPTAAPTAVEPTQPSSGGTTLGVLKLVDWETPDFRPDNSCSDPAQEISCWTGRGYEMVMESADYILIDPAWSQPMLEFNHRYIFNMDSIIYIKRRSSGQWEIFRTYPAASIGYWVPQKLDLRKYIGEEVLFRFTTGGSSRPNFGKNPPKNVWTLQDIRISTGK